MSSCVFYRFKSSKDVMRVGFDGTGISIYELRGAILSNNGLGDGADVDLSIKTDSGDVIDDASVIPRSSTVVVQRLPAKKDQNRYRPPNISKAQTQRSKQLDVLPVPPASMAINRAQTEEQSIATMFQMGANDWARQQEHMATAVPVHRSAQSKTKMPSHEKPPPPGYLCYRCGQKGHWIMDCPTNDDPNFVGRPRIKRTTGIPKSFLKTVAKPIPADDVDEEVDNKQPLGVMVNAEGEWVVAEPDQAAWDRFHAQARTVEAPQTQAIDEAQAAIGQHVLCPIDRKLFVHPTDTPCCQKTYCKACIQNALLENNLECPNCRQSDVLIDDLATNTDLASKIKAFETSQLDQNRKRENEEEVQHITSAGPTPAERSSRDLKNKESDSNNPRLRISRKRPRPSG